MYSESGLFYTNYTPFRRKSQMKVTQTIITKKKIRCIAKEQRFLKKKENYTKVMKSQEKRHTLMQRESQCDPSLIYLAILGC